MLQLVREHNRFSELRRRLIEADREIDETTLLDTLEGATNLSEAIGEVVRAALEEEALADSLRAQGLATEHSAVTPYASPRRLAAHVSAVLAAAPDKAVAGC